MSIQQLCDQSKWPLTEILSSYCNQGNNLDNKDNYLTLRNKNTYIEFSTCCILLLKINTIQV